MILDMMYTLVTMMAGGFHPKDMLDELERNPEDFLILLGSRLPAFGLYGSLVMEVLGAFMLAKNAEVVAPISLAGLLKYISNGFSGIGGIFDMAMGNETTDKQQASMINMIRVIPLLGETLVRLGLHATLRSGKSRGAIGAFGGDKTYHTFGAKASEQVMDPNTYFEDVLMELFPTLFPEDIEQLDFEDWIAARQGVSFLEDQKRDVTDAPMYQQTEPVQTSPDPIRTVEPTGSSLRAPTSLGGSRGTQYLKSPKST